MTKFNKIKFMEVFKEELLTRYKERLPAVIISLSSVAMEVCRKLHYTMWSNRDEMILLIKDWWNTLPVTNDRGEAVYKLLFNRKCLLSCNSGPTFISLYPNRNGIQGMDLITWY